MYEDELFTILDGLVNKSLNLLTEQADYLTLVEGGVQKRSDLKQGVVYHKGIYVPLKSISFRLLYDGYHTVFLKALVLMCKGLMTDKDSVSSEFSFRTIFEMGVYQAQALFSKELSDEKRNRFKLLNMLKDYGSLAYENKEHLDNFSKLYDNLGNILSDYQKKKIQMLLDSIKNKNFSEFIKSLAEIRNMTGAYSRELYDQTSISEIILVNKLKMKTLFSTQSDLIHGNVFHINNIFSKHRSPHQHILRIYFFTILALANTINLVKELIPEKGLKDNAEAILADYQDIKPKVNEFWKQSDEAFYKGRL